MLRSPADIWKRIQYKDRANREICPGGFRLFRYTFQAPEILNGKRLLFLSDFHIRSSTFRNIVLPPEKSFSVYGTDFLKENLPSLLERTRPDFFVFGGDLAGEAAWIDDAFSLFRLIPESVIRLAVPGNWDKRRRRWLHQSFWQEAYESIGFHYLLNSECSFNGISFYGLDDYKIGTPRFHPRNYGKPECFNCLVSHNPDAIPYGLTREDLAGTNLILCGHTHAGQVRLPFFGALKTSSRYYKRFEHGLYEADCTKTKMIVTAGVGTTFIPLRFLCPPEAVLIEFRSENEPFMKDQPSGL